MGLSGSHRHPPLGRRRLGRAAFASAAIALLAGSAAAENGSPAATADRERPFCTTACRPGAGSVSSGVGFAAGIAATLLVSRRRERAARRPGRAAR